MEALIAFHLLVFCAFWMLYYTFANHFTFRKRPDLLDITHVTMNVHGTVGYDDAAPRTQVAKALTTAHIGCVIFGSLLVLKTV